jgi:hypothetical protein
MRRVAGFMTLFPIVAVACLGCTSESTNPTAGDGGNAGTADASTGGGTSGGTGGVAGSGGASTGGVAGTDAGTAGTGPCYTIHVQGAVYAANCGAPTPMPTIAQECDGKENCTYLVDTGGKDPKGDPAPGCWKDLTVQYDCVGDSSVQAQKSSYTTMVHDNTQVVLECCPP